MTNRIPVIPRFWLRVRRWWSDARWAMACKMSSRVLELEVDRDRGVLATEDLWASADYWERASYTWEVRTTSETKRLTELVLDTERQLREVTRGADDLVDERNNALKALSIAHEACENSRINAAKATNIAEQAVRDLKRMTVERDTLQAGVSSMYEQIKVRVGP